MLTLVNSLPWFFFVVWGVLGIPYIIWWVIKSTNNDPLLLRVGWALMSINVLIVVIDNLFIGTGTYVEYMPILDWISIPLVILTCALIFIGGYQKTMRPNFDPEKRRTVVLCMYGLVITAICFGLFFGGFYVYDNFFGK